VRLPEKPARKHAKVKRTEKANGFYPENWRLRKARIPRRTNSFWLKGISAGGSAKQGRDSKFQAILPLRGKVLNTEKASIGDIEKNEELNTIIHALGSRCRQ
jgi:topoisomerase IV subunit B